MLAPSFEVFMAVIRMLKSVGSNVAGEVCGYPEELAAELVSKSLAVYVTTAPVEVITKAESAQTTAVIEAEPSIVDEFKGFLKKKKKG